VVSLIEDTEVLVMAECEEVDEVVSCTSETTVVLVTTLLVGSDKWLDDPELGV